MRDLYKILAATLAGMTVDEFKAEAKTWLETARHPRWNRPYTELTYQPMIEVLRYLRDNAYKTYIVTGGGQDFVRVYADRVYGIAQFEQAVSAGNPNAGPMAPQSIGAQLGYQPTPASIKRAEQRAKAAFAATLARAKRSINKEIELGVRGRWPPLSECTICSDRLRRSPKDRPSEVSPGGSRNKCDVTERATACGQLLSRCHTRVDIGTEPFVS